jgi:hypothetical protein
MLGAAETDFEADGADIIKKDAQIGWRRLAEIERYFRQQTIEQRRLPRPQRMALAAPEEGALRLFRIWQFAHAVIVRGKRTIQ